MDLRCTDGIGVCLTDRCSGHLNRASDCVCKHSNDSNGADRRCQTATMPFAIAIATLLVMATLSGCDSLPAADAEVRALIESKYDTTVGVAARQDQLFIISLYDTEAFELAPVEQRRLADSIASDIVDAMPNTLLGLSVIFGENEPRRGVAMNYVYQIRSDVPVFKELLQPARDRG